MNANDFKTLSEELRNLKSAIGRIERILEAEKISFEETEVQK
jgi:hypothetical protein